MVKYVSLLRHARAHKEAREVCDHARALTSCGIEDAATLGAWMMQQGMRFDAVVCSTAERARQTFAALGVMAHDLPIPIYTAELYLAPAVQILEELSQLGERIERVLVIGHNPGLHEAVLELAQDIPAQYGELQHRFPTSAFVEMSLPVESWQELHAGCGTVDACRMGDV